MLALALRLIRLGTHPYWQDEVHNLLQAEQLGKVLLTGDLASNHPPLPVILVAGWRALGLDGNEWIMRMLPVTLGLLGLLAVWGLGRRLYGPRAGLFAAFIMAIAPFHIYHSQELKEYIVLPLTGTLAVWALYEAAEQNKRRWWCAYALLAALACYSDLFAGPLLIGVNLWFMVWLPGRWNRFWPWVISNIVGALLFLPQLGVMWHLAKATILDLTAWWVPRPSLMRVAFYLKTLAFGYSDWKPWFYIAFGLFCLLALAGAFVALWKSPKNALLLICWFVIPIALVYAISMVTQSVFLIRSMIPYAMPFYLLIGIGLASIPKPAIRFASLGLIAASVAPGLIARYECDWPLAQLPHRPGVHPPQQFDKAAAFIKGNWQEGDIIVHPSTDPTFLPFIWYGLRGHPQYRADVSEEFIRYFYTANPVTTTTHPDVKTYWIRQLQPLVQGRSRVWFVFSEWERDLLWNFPRGVWRWMDAHFAQIMHEDFQGFEVYLYAAEADGRPVPVLERDQDNGVTAQVTYAGAYAGKYTWIKPDIGVVPSPPEARRGRLTLAFDTAPQVSPHPLGPATAVRDVPFALENRSDQPVRCRVVCMPSDCLIDAAALYENDPDSEVWRVYDTYNPNPPPDDFDVPCAVACFRNSEPASVSGQFSFAPGAYRTACFLFGAPGREEQGRARLSGLMDQQPLLGPEPYPNLPAEWHWITGKTVDIPASQEPLPFTLQAFPPRRAAESWANIVAVALNKVRDGENNTAPGTPLPLWPGEMTVLPNYTQRWTAQIGADVGRLDVWVYELGEDGRGYRIFRTFDPNGAS